MSCKRAKFATVGTDLRMEGGPKGIDAAPYTVSGDTLIVFDMHGDGGAPHAYVFRRRP